MTQRKPINTKTIYSSKAEKYAKYRWDYAAGAIKAIVELTELTNHSTVADIGAGTGILTKHFANKVKKIYAVEPNLELRLILKNALGIFTSVSVMDSCAENTNLSARSVDVITVAQAIHWFEPKLAKHEMMRILKDDGWLVLLRNYSTNKVLNKVIGSLMSEEYGADFSVANKQAKEKSPDFYFGNDNFQKLVFPFKVRQHWEDFIGALTTASYMPDDDHPLFEKLESKAKEIFSLYSEDAALMIEGETEIIIGQPSK